jgi:hypothetical protein
MSEENLPTEYRSSLQGVNLPIGVMALLDDNLGKRLERAAANMARAEGMVPNHLINKPVACYAVITRAMTWRLDPFAVAASTYQTPGGKVGYEGKLVQAILENSGRIEGQIIFDHYGDWTKVEGKFKKEQSQKGNSYFVPTYTDADEAGLGVVVRAKIKGEAIPREADVSLRSCQPRNSTLWALRPKQQIMYAAIRVFANVAAPSLFMGIPFSSDMMGESMIDITPESEASRQRPMREDFVTTMDRNAGKADDTGFVQDVEPAQEQEAADEAAEDFSVADAFEMGRKARQEGKALRAVPPEWRDNPNCQNFVEGWQEGWRAEDTELKTSK